MVCACTLLSTANNGQVGAGGFVHYSEVSFIGRFTIIIRLRYPKCEDTIMTI